MARVWSGTVNLIDQDNPDTKKNALQYLHTQYKNSNCLVFSQIINNSIKDKGITHEQKEVIYTSICYK